MKMTKSLCISIVVSTYNRRDLVARTLKTIFDQEYPASKFEVIVVVDGATDGTADALMGLTPTCSFRVIEQENRGLAGARNTGYRAAESDLVLFLDDDMLCDPGLVAAHVRTHKGGERIAAFGALFLSPDSPHSLAAECFNREIGAFHLAHKKSSAVRWNETDCVFSNSSICRELLEEFHGFDERFRMREDQELGLRLFRGGVVPAYVSDAKAFQHYEKTSSDLIRDAEEFAKADLLLAAEHPEALVPGQVNVLRRKSAWKRRVTRIAVKAPVLWDIALSPLCGIGSVFNQIAVLRGMGVRALQIRRRVHWLHKVIQAGGL
jgi:glycosyltransferase involved in cell wall biosynthesis